MDYENLLTGTKWEILQEISQRKQSPLELAKKLNTTIANISQQIRLLEAAKLVSSEKTRESEKGKPRVLYSISNNRTYIVSLQKGFAEKRLFETNLYHDIVLKTWQFKNIGLHKELNRLILELDSKLNKISSIGIDDLTNEVYILGEKQTVKSKLNVKFLTKNQFEGKKSENIFIIYEKSEVELK